MESNGEGHKGHTADNTRGSTGLPNPGSWLLWRPPGYTKFVKLKKKTAQCMIKS